MRSGTLLAIMSPIAILSSASAAGLPNNIPRTTLTSRAIDVPVCAKVAFNVNLVDGLRTLPLGNTLANLVQGAITLANAVPLVPDVNPVLNLGDLCLCANAGLLTENSIANIATAISSSNNDALLNAVGTVADAAVDVIQPISLGLLDNATPNPTCTTTDTTAIVTPDDTCTTCTITCPGQQTYCNGACNDNCPTVDMGRKRSVKERSRYACPQPLTACPVSHFLARETAATYGGGFECIDTTSNLESCGGCATPFTGSPAGEDCTAIANVDSVSCTFGRCIVDSCAPGFVPTADSSACQKAARFSSSRLTVQGRRSRK